MDTPLVFPALLSTAERELVNKAFDELYSQRARAMGVAYEKSLQHNTPSPNRALFGLKEVQAAQSVVISWAQPFIPAEHRKMALAALRCLYQVRMFAYQVAQLATDDIGGALPWTPYQFGATDVSDLVRKLGATV